MLGCTVVFIENRATDPHNTSRVHRCLTTWRDENVSMPEAVQIGCLTLFAIDLLSVGSQRGENLSGGIRPSQALIGAS